eukprot:4923751-Amphidinium_carterae.1
MMQHAAPPPWRTLSQSSRHAKYTVREDRVEDQCRCWSMGDKKAVSCARGMRSIVHTVRLAPSDFACSFAVPWFKHL